MTAFAAHSTAQARPRRFRRRAPSAHPCPGPRRGADLCRLASPSPDPAAQITHCEWAVTRPHGVAA